MNRCRGLGAAVLALLLAACGDATGPRNGAHPDLHPGWEEVAPASVGMDAAALGRAADSVFLLPAARSLLVAREGRLVLERYAGGAGPDTRFDVRSVTKSVVSSLTGIAIHEGKLAGLDVKAARWLGAAYVMDAADSAVTVAHLLTMSSGFQWNDDVDYNPWVVSDRPVQFLLDRSHVALPGATFTYSSAAVHALGVALGNAVDQGLESYTASRLLAPLGISGFGWERLNDGRVNAGSGIAFTGRDLLKLGQLMLQDGWSGDRSVVPEAWVREATRPHFTWRTNYAGGETGVSYGYLWWTADGPPAAFFAWGFGGQFVYVVPGLDLVVVTTTDWGGMTFPVAGQTGTRLLGLIRRLILPTAHAAPAG